MIDAYELVREFHEKHGYPIGEKLQGITPTSNFLGRVSEKLVDISASMRSVSIEAMTSGDHRAYRLWLIVEEVAELGLALQESNLLDTADAITDLLYVVVGLCVTYGLPVEALLSEVHKSNMTKKIRDKLNDPRMRDKGSSWVPPNFRGILNGRVK
jgi:predicted HAD superfamily Cof-like phosphohydrolase